MKPLPAFVSVCLTLFATAALSAQYVETFERYRATTGAANWANGQWVSQASGPQPDEALDTNLSPTPTAADLVIFNTDALNTTGVTSRTTGNRSARGLVFRTSGDVLITGHNGDYWLETFASGVTVEAGAGAVTIGTAATGGLIQPRLRATQTWANHSSNVLTVRGGGSNLVMWLAPTVATPGDLVLTLSGSGAFALPTIQFRGVVVDEQVTQLAALAYTSGVTISGNLRLEQSTSPIALIFNPTAALTVTGTTSFLGGPFGIPNLIGLDGNTTDFGTYSIISGTVDLTNVVNVGPGDAFDIGGGKWAHFTSEPSGLQVVVAVPEPAVLAGLFGLAALGLALLRRRA